MSTGRVLWLHCGAFKTGSSRIQTHAWEQRDALLDAGWLYPRAGLSLDEPEVGVRHTPLVYRWRDRPAWEALVDDLVAEVVASPAPRVLLSSEAWSRPGAEDSLTALLTRLRDAGAVQEVRAVVYLRNRLSYARSLHRELVRRRAHVRDLDDFVAGEQRLLDPVAALRALHAALDAVGGSLEVRSYEQAPDTAADLFAHLGLPFDPGPHARTNTGLDACETEALRQLTQVAPETRSAWPGLEAVLDAAVVPVALERAAWSERVSPGRLDLAPDQREQLARLTGWDDTRLDLLLRTGEPGHRDVTALAGLLRGLVADHVAATHEEVVDTVVRPSPAVSALELDAGDLLAPEVRVSGLLLLAAGVPADGTRLLVVSDEGEQEADTGRASAGFGRRHPDRPEAGAARFAVRRVRWGSGRRLSLVLALASGERHELAELRRRWQPR